MYDIQRKLPTITEKQKEMIYLTLRYRFLHRLHLQAFLHHKDKSMINIYLKDLVTKQYLRKIPTANNFKSNTELSIYHMGINGIRFLKTRENIPSHKVTNLYKEKFKKESFRNRCQLIADICLMLLKKNTIAENTQFSFILPDEYENPDSSLHFLSALKPHLCFIKKNGRKKNYYLLEVFEQNLPNYRRKKRIKTYIEFFQGYEWEENINGSYPVILFVCPTKQLLISSKRMTKKLFEDEKLDYLPIRFTTEDDVKAFGVTGEIWEEVAPSEFE